MENFRGTKSWNFLEGLKWKVDIFIGTKNIFKPKSNITYLKGLNMSLVPINITTFRFSRS